jgi:hypothetical protein
MKKEKTLDVLKVFHLAVLRLGAVAVLFFLFLTKGPVDSGMAWRLDLSEAWALRGALAKVQHHHHPPPPPKKKKLQNQIELITKKKTSSMIM